jgi:hypothetical protein
MGDFLAYSHPLIDEIPMGLVGMGPHLSIDFVSEEHRVPRDGPKDSNARGLNVGDLGSQRNTVTEASRRRMHNTLQRETPSLSQVQGPRGEVKLLLPAFLYYDAIPREEYKALVTEL